jgi:hypothetical protein
LAALRHAEAHGWELVDNLWLGQLVHVTHKVVFGFKRPGTASFDD